MQECFPLDEGMSPRIVRFFSVNLLCLAFLAGCVSAQKYDLRTTRISARSRVEVIDSRPSESKTFRIERRGFGAAPVWHYGDSNFKPSAVVALADEMSIQLPSKVKGPVTLTSLDMTLYRPKSQAYGAESTPGIGPGGVLLGKAIFGESYGGSTQEEDLMTCSFDVEIAGKKYTVVQQENAKPNGGIILKGVSTEWHECIEGAVYDLAKQIGVQ